MSLLDAISRYSRVLAGSCDFVSAELVWAGGVGVHEWSVDYGDEDLDAGFCVGAAEVSHEC